MITSAANAKVKQVIQWQTKSKERKKDKVYLVEGFKMFREAPMESIREVYISKDAMEKLKKEPWFADSDECKKLNNISYEIVADDIFRKMSDTQTPQGILTVLRQPDYSLEKLLDTENGLFVVLENLQDPGNLGTIIRTGEGAGITGVIMSAGTVDIFNPKVIRATMGSIYRVPFVYVPDICEAIGQMNAKGIRTYAAHLQGKTYYDSFSFKEPTAFIIGNEGNGLEKATADAATHYLKIPMEGEVESLNAAIATSLLMYEAHRQRG